MRIFLKYLLEGFLLPVLIIAAYLSRCSKRKLDIGLGPLPLINNIHHKKALLLQGWTAETFVTDVFFITQDFDHLLHIRWKSFPKFFILIFGFLWSIQRYKCLYLYFNGGFLSRTTLLWRFEAYLLNLADIKTVVLAYGSDVQEMTRSPNLRFKHVMSLDYPIQFRKRDRIGKMIDLWNMYGSHIVGGCEWVDYMPGWDSLMIAHFSIDTDDWAYAPVEWGGPSQGPLRVLHAPNHRSIKGTQFLIEAVAALQAEKCNVELVLMEKVPNHKIQEVMGSCHVLVDQLVIGWYAMFAIEGMAMGRPVLCHVRKDLVNLYEFAGLLNEGEIPLIDTNHSEIKNTLLDLYNNPTRLTEIGERGRKYVEKHHSIQSVGKAFDIINLKIGLSRSGVNV